MPSDSTTQHIESRSAWSAFMEGLTRPSLPAACLTIVLASAMLWSATWIVTPTFFADHAGYFAPRPQENYTFTTAKAILAGRAPRDQLAVTIMGASAHREGISSDAKMTQLLHQGSGLPIRFNNLTASALSQHEIVALCDQLGEGYQGVVVIGCSIFRMARDPDERVEWILRPRVGVTSAWLDDEASRMNVERPAPTGWYFIDQAGFLGVRLPYLFRNLVRGPIKPRTHSYIDMDAIDEQQWDERVEAVRALFRSPDRPDPGDIEAMWLRLRDRLRSRGPVEIVLLDAPTNPRFIEQAVGTDVFAAYQSRMASFADEHGLHYWNLNEESRLEPGDFFDWVHLSSTDAQERFTKALANRLNTLIHSRFPGGYRP